jgi:tRNA (guanine-N7-)-methyltransferase
MNQPLTSRTVHSFVCRGRNLKPAQQEAFDILWQQWGMEPNQRVDLEKVFARKSEKHLEIGFGAGECLVNMAKKNPQNDYIGIEVYIQGIHQVLKQIEIEKLSNIRLFYTDAIDVLEKCFQSNSLDTIYIFFPDPWPKKRHFKRRLIQPTFIDLVAQRLKSEGSLYLATDWENYAAQMLEILESNAHFINTAGKGNFSNRTEIRTLTKFERRGQTLGHSVWDLIYAKK